jgi:4-amino-4-deoxy-L-arabinose transferase-like glycosyltransferase
MRRVWDWLDTTHARNLILIALAAPFVAFAVSVVFPGLRHPFALALAPVVAVLAHQGARTPRRPSVPLTKWEIVLIATGVAVVGLFFLVSPSYLGRIL